MRARRDDPHTLAAPYALGALPAGDQARFERHLAGCEACAAELRGLRETAAQLAAATAAPPPARLRERVLAEAARTRQLPPAGAAVAGRPGRSHGWSRSAGPSAAGRPRWIRPVAVAVSGAVAAAAVVFGVLAAGAQHTLDQSRAREHMLAVVLTSPDAKMMDASVTGGGTASVVMSSSVHALAFSSAGLPALPPGQAYELWLRGAQGPRSAGMLPRAQHGMTSPLVATGLRPGDMIELTVEPAGGAPRPTTAALLMLPI
jgi:anti-sigma-K factor RskA